MTTQQDPRAAEHERKAVLVVVPTGTNYLFAPLFVPTICSALPDGGRLVVVDNGFSTRYTAELEGLSDHYPFAHLRPVQPLSYAAACNFGISALSASSDVFDYVIVSNDDVVVPKDAIGVLISGLAEDASRATCGPELRYFDGTPQGSAYADFSWWKFAALGTGVIRFKGAVERTSILRSAIGHLPKMEQHRTYTAMTAVPVVKGAFLAVRGRAWRELSGFDPRFQHYGEENDFCYRARQLGYVNVVDPSALVFHYGRGSSRGGRRGLSRRSKLAALQLAEFHGSPMSRRAAMFVKQLLRRAEAGRPVRSMQDKG